MSALAKCARVAEGLYRFSLNGKTSGPYYAYFWRDGKQIKKKLEAVGVEHAQHHAGREGSPRPCLTEDDTLRSPRALSDHDPEFGETFGQHLRIFCEAHQGRLARG